jgi:uncharacterized membrane protein
MVALVFLLVIAAVFAAILALEGGDARLERRPAGLLTWIASGNWPAKIGGALMIVGVGALLRYAAINFAVPDLLKLGVGIAASVAFGAGSHLLAGNPQRRAISLALGGAAFGVAYLTAYSAFALFDYLPSTPGLGLLALTAIAAGVFAVSRSALSLAVLSMVGAFMAPAFAVQDPGASVVYGYYVAVSVLTLGMVAIRGWRPLIHLSFLFTLAGGAFFAWTADYFDRSAAPQMLPLIALLVAVHVAMPLVERRSQRGVLIESMDTIYLLALPLTGALTALLIAPSRAALAVELWWFAAIWFAAAAWLFTQKREGMATHAVIALLMAGFGLAAQFRDLPWELVALAIGVISLALAARRSEYVRLHSFLAGLILVLGAIHILSALGPAVSDSLFLNERFLERIIGAGLLAIAALSLRRLRHPLDSLMLTVAIGWSAFAVGAEVSRLDLVSAWLLLHWAIALALCILVAVAGRFPRAVNFMGPLLLALGFSALLAGVRTHDTLAWISALIAAVSMLAVALRRPAEQEFDPSRMLGAIGAPIVTAVWMACYAPTLAGSQWQFPLAFGAACAVLTLLVAERAPQRSERWFSEAADIFAVGFTFVLAAATIFDIGRGPAAILLELTCVAGLVRIAAWDGKRLSVGEWILPATVIGVALMLQANLLRWLGPPTGHLSLLSIARMNWPTLVSLLWASIGAALTIAARRAGSRVQWSAGAAFLVGAALKLVLLDFGSLGQLANIIAVIAAGGVFLLVGWLAPMPPARDKKHEDTPQPPAAPPAHAMAAAHTAAHPARPVAPPAAPRPMPHAAPVAGHTAVHATTPAPAAPHSHAAPASARMGGGPAQAPEGGGIEMPESYWHANRPPPARRERDSNDRLAWAIAIGVFVLFTLTRCVSLWRHPFAVHQNHLQPGMQLSDPQYAEDQAESAPAAASAGVPAPAVEVSESAVEPAPPVVARNPCRDWARQLPSNYKV